MGNAAFADPALTVALALAVGMFAQALARHLKIPGIVLLGMGVLLGPAGLDVVRPATRAELDTRAGCIGLTSNEEVNLLFARGRARISRSIASGWPYAGSTSA